MNAKELAQFAAQCDQLAGRIKPADTDPLRLAKELIRYHLISAATQSRKLAEAEAGKVGPQ